MDFSRIYPTPPSVESTDEKFEEAKTMIGVGMNINEDRNESFEISLMMVNIYNNKDYLLIALFL